jgi:membrane fusion protein, multidrug efflux system
MRPYIKPLLLGAGAVVVIVGSAWAGDRLLSGNAITQKTNDAYVTADFSVVAPQVSGRIDRVIAHDNEIVHAGEELAHIEDADYRAALETKKGNVISAGGEISDLNAEIKLQQSIIDGARAVVVSDEAELIFARQNAERYRNLSAGGAGTIERQQASEAHLREAEEARTRDRAAVETATRKVAVLQAQLEEAKGNLLRAQGEQQQAELNLSYCTIPAPVAGVVGERGVRVGAYVHAGTSLLAVVPTQAAYVLANFQETQLTHIRTGQQAVITVDTFPGQRLRAHVDSLAPATGVTFAPIQPDNATGNFTKVVQRIPVKLVFDPGQPLAEKVRVGMSIEAAINTSSKPDGAHATALPLATGEGDAKK